MDVGDKVSVTHNEETFTGEIEMIVKWTTIFNSKDKQVEYVVRADDDEKLYSCPPETVTNVK